MTTNTIQINDATTVPDTLDLTHNARLAIRGICNTLNPEQRYHMMFHCVATSQPAFLEHCFGDNTCDTKYGESLALMRLMSGSDEHLDIEQAFRNELLSRVDSGTYWSRAEGGPEWRTWYIDGFPKDNSTEQDLAIMVGQGRMMRTLMIWHEQDPHDDNIKAMIDSMVEGTNDWLVHRKDEAGHDYAHHPINDDFGEAFAYPRQEPGKSLPYDRVPNDENEGGEGSVNCYHGHQARSLARWYLMTGHERALELAGKITRYMMRPEMWGGRADTKVERPAGLTATVTVKADDPAGIAGHEQGHCFTHFHGRAVGLRGILEYAIAANDQTALEFVKRSYDFTWSYGIPRIGWINSSPGIHNAMEAGCVVGDSLALGIRLSETGVGDYWEIIDSITRNFLVEAHLTDYEEIVRANSHAGEKEPGMFPNRPEEMVTTEDAMQRMVGTMAAGAHPHYAHPHAIGCCTGNGTQGIYYAWEAALRENIDDRSATVNLLINRVGQNVRVDSYLPYEGRVLVHVTGVQPLRRVSIRIPSWIDRRGLRVRVNQQDRPLDILGTLLIVTDIHPGQTIELTFEVPSTTATYTGANNTPSEARYACTFRGSTCTGITGPEVPDTGYRFFRREHMQSDQPPYAEKSLYVPTQIVSHW